MNKIKDKVTIFQAVQAMINGLYATEKMDNFHINMSYFLSRIKNNPHMIEEYHRGNKVCWGCAASATVMQITGVQYTDENLGVSDEQELWVRSRIQNIGKLDLLEFEQAINDFRVGNTLPLANYFDIENPFHGTEDWELRNDNWLTQLTLVQDRLNSVNPN